jgi:hypothetical protein
MDDRPLWRVGVEKKVVQVIRGESPDVQLDYMRALSSLVNLADKYNEICYAACTHGFLIPLRKGKLRCATIGDKSQILVFEYFK